jgi:REP element-mobilizing transposase RayT
MTFNSDDHHRHSTRLHGYDYSQGGAYFVTICTHNRECSFGEMSKNEVALNDSGMIVRAEWLKTAEMRRNIELCEFVIMPNHIHGIILIQDNRRGTLQRAPISERFGRPTSNSIPSIICGFKSSATKRINELRNAPGVPVWQRNYYEHIIRDEDDLNRIREYIECNPLRWSEDDENPERIKS